MKDNPKRPFLYSGKGVFEYQPDLKNSKDKPWDEGIVAKEKLNWKSGALTAAGDGAFFVLSHAAPYPIAAHQADNAAAEWDVLKNPCDQTATFAYESTGPLTASVSTDNGQTWTPVGDGGGSGLFDFSDIVKGRFAYQLKIGLGKKTALRAYTVRTVVQIGPAVFPRLKDNGSEIRYLADGVGVIHGGPDWRQAMAYRRSDLDRDGWMTYAINAPGAIRSLQGMTMATGRVKVRIETSLDGKKWDAALEDVGTTATGREPTSSVWGNGTLAIMWGGVNYPAGASTTGYIRFRNGVENGTQVFATYQQPSQTGIEIEVCWSDSRGERQTLKKTLKPSDKEQSFRVPTGANVVTHWIRFRPADK